MTTPAMLKSYLLIFFSCVLLVVGYIKFVMYVKAQAEASTEEKSKELIRRHCKPIDFQDGKLVYICDENKILLR